MDKSAGNRLTKILVNIIINIIVLIFLFPIIWMAILSTNNRTDISNFPPPFLPGKALLENYQRLVDAIPFFKNLLNSVCVGFFSTLIVLFVCSFAAYGFARYKSAPGNKILLYVVVASIMIPPLAGLIPWFMLVNSLGWINTFWPLIIPPAANAFGVFWMYQFIKESVPEELYEAAKVDGATDFGVYWRIVIPIIRPGLGALAVLTFLNVWQNFQIPLIVLNEVDKFTIPLALANLSTLYGTDIPAVMLGTTISLLPIFVAFLLATRHFIAGLTSGSVKS